MPHPSKKKKGFFFSKWSFVEYCLCTLVLGTGSPPRERAKVDQDDCDSHRECGSDCPFLFLRIPVFHSRGRAETKKMDLRRT